MDEFGGIDLRSNNGVVAISDEAHRTLTNGACQNDLTQIRDVLAPYCEDDNLSLQFLTRNNAP
jgi:hypothetical protein